MPPLGPLPNPNNATSTLIGPGNAASLFPTISPAAMPGPVPYVNVGTSFVGAGNASGLFPEITPAPAPSPGPGGTIPAAERGVSPAGRAVDVFTGAPATPVLGLIALAVAFLLVMTRLSVRRRKKGAAGLLPETAPAPTPAPSPGPGNTNPAAERGVSPAGRAVGISAGAPATPVLGLIALAAASLLVMTRLLVRRRINRRGRRA